MCRRVCRCSCSLSVCVSLCLSCRPLSYSMHIIVYLHMSGPCLIFVCVWSVSQCKISLYHIARFLWFEHKCRQYQHQCIEYWCVCLYFNVSACFVCLCMYFQFVKLCSVGLVCSSFFAPVSSGILRPLSCRISRLCRISRRLSGVSVPGKQRSYPYPHVS